MWSAIVDELNGTFSAVHPGIAAVRLTVAVLLGGVIGWEREMHDKSAGLRTHMMISLAACLFILVGQEIVLLPWNQRGELQVDPLRMIEAVTAGVAFLAAGVIFTSGQRVRNLTTGAGMWLAGALGLACGAGLVPLALVAATITLVVLSLVRRLTPPNSERLGDRGEEIGRD